MMTRRLASDKTLAPLLITFQRSMTAETSLKRMSHKIQLMTKRTSMMSMRKKRRKKSCHMRNNPKYQPLLLMNRISS
tara:strand:- start:223 stop:453 length:231 start_codon:yes stop_codon:yes gene_type:complete